MSKEDDFQRALRAALDRCAMMAAEAPKPLPGEHPLETYSRQMAFLLERYPGPRPGTLTAHPRITAHIL